MSPGVATPWPAAPPIPIAKVCFMSPSLAESRPIRHDPALGPSSIQCWHSCARNSLSESPARFSGQPEYTPKSVLPLPEMGGGAADSGAGAFAPEEVGGETEEHDDDCGDEIVELVR